MANDLWLEANDIGYDYLKPNSYRMIFHNIPKVSYFCQTATIPGVNLGSATQPTKFLDVPVVGDKLVYDPVTIQFIIDAEMKNWQELHTWITGIGFPNDHQEFNDLRASGTQKSLSQKLTKLNEESGVYADATLTILTAKSNPYMTVTFSDIYPIALSAIQMDATITEVNYLTCNATFMYKAFSYYIL